MNHYYYECFSCQSQFSKQQIESLEILKAYNVDVSEFIREAIRAKTKRDWPSIKEAKNKVKPPF